MTPPKLTPHFSCRPQVTGVHPSQTEVESLSFGNLTVEIRTDRVMMYGNTDITRDKTGPAKGRQLHDMLAQIVETLEGDSDLPDEVAPAKTSKSPFA